MSSIILNKTFINRYFYRYMKLFVEDGADIYNENSSPNGALHVDIRHTQEGYPFVQYWGAAATNYGIVDVYEDLNVNTKLVAVASNDGDPQYGVSQFMLVTKSFLDILDSINTAKYDGTLDSIAIDDPYESLGVVNFRRLSNTLLSRNITARDNALSWLVNSGIITQTQSDNAKVSTPMKSYIKSNLSFTYNSTNDTYYVQYSRPMELLNSYREANNVGSEPLFFIYIPVIYSDYSDPVRVNDIVNTGPSGGVGDLYYNFHVMRESNAGVSQGKLTIDLYSKSKDDVVQQLPYFALSVGEKDSGADLEYDYLDRIDFIDDFRFQIKLPNKIQ